MTSPIILCNLTPGPETSQIFLEVQKLYSRAAIPNEISDCDFFLEGNYEMGFTEDAIKKPPEDLFLLWGLRS